MTISVGEKLAFLWRWIVTATEFVVLLLVSIVNALHFSYENGAIPIAFAFLLIGYGLICVAVHEMGHAVAAWLVGWRVHLVVVWRLAFAPKSKRFQLFAGGRHQDFGGWVLATPSQDADWNRGIAPFFLGGAAGNVAFGVLCIAAAAASDPDSSPFVVFVWLGEMSFILAVSSLVPVWRPGHWKNDGARLLAAARGGGLTAKEMKISRLVGMNCDGVAFEEWDQTLRELLEADPSAGRGSIDPLLFDYAFASADLPAARIILERNLVVDPEQRCIHAFIIAMMDRDAPRASEILDDLPEDRTRSSFSYWRARSVVEHLSGRRALALKAAHHWREAAQRLSVELDEDDEGVLRAIELGEMLPGFQPRPGSVRLAPFLEQSAAEHEPDRTS